MREDKYFLGLVSISFRDRDPETILQAMQQARLSYVEWGSDVHAPCWDVERLREIAALQKQYGISCSSYGTYFRLGETPIEELGDYIAAAKILDTDILRLWCGTKSGADMTEAERNILLEECRAAAKIAEEIGVMLCMECHKRTLTERCEDTLLLMRAIDSPHFRMYWQPFQWQSVKENLAYAEAISPFAEHLHVFQWKGKERFSLNEGIEEWKSYLKNFSTPRTLLLEFMPDDRIETLPTEAQALKIIIGDTI